MIEQEMAVYQGNTEIVTPFVVSEGDERVIDMWVKEHRSKHTQRYYSGDSTEFLMFARVGIREVGLDHIQRFEESLSALEPGTVARKINVVKSLLTFCYELGYTSLNVGKVHHAPTVQSHLAHRILTEEQVFSLINAVKDNPRNHAILRLLYHAGLRVSEVVAIRWSDVIDRGELGAQISIVGKGEKQRQIVISSGMYDELKSLRNGTGTDTSALVFQSRQSDGTGRMLDMSIVNKIVTRAAIDAHIDGNVSPHWLRHSHASHSLDRGANINLVRDTLGHESLATTGKYTHARPNTSSSQFLPL